MAVHSLVLYDPFAPLPLLPTLHSCICWGWIQVTTCVTNRAVAQIHLDLFVFFLPFFSTDCPINHNNGSNTDP